jgi:glycine hydroxymethyltransferase
MAETAAWMDEVAQHLGDEARLARIAGAVRELCGRFPAPGLRV